MEFYNAELPDGWHVYGELEIDLLPGRLHISVINEVTWNIEVTLP